MRIAVAGGTGTVGHHVVALAERAGHDVVALSRSRGVDARNGQGLGEALRGASVVVDVTHPDSLEQEPATEFWTDVATSLQRTGDAQGVGHIVTLSIVGIEKTSFGYYLAQMEHERAASGPVPSTIMRATQFHELPARLMALTRHDSHAQVLDIKPVRPVAARTVAEVLLELAESAPAGRAPDLAGPQEEGLVELAREFVDRRGEALTVDAATVTGIPPRALLPDNGARIEGPTYEEWLASDDAAAMTI